MRIARITTPSGPRHVVDRGGVWCAVADPFAGTLVETGETWDAGHAQLLAPVEPRVVVGMSHNGSAADRALPPQAFLKSARTVVGPHDPIRLDAGVGLVNAETELAVVIGRTVRHLAPDDVPGAILGCTVANDVTAVDQVALDHQLVQSKNGSGFTPLGPWIETELDWSDAALGLSIDGRTAASSSTAGLAYDVVEILVYLTAHLELGPGDVVLTGAPGTSVAISPGMDVGATVAGIGELRNPVVAAASVAVTLAGAPNGGLAA
jgi:2-keto-4-pentenoate hydratase/2-oxohepta-3-ene-1,7-dioic acid hydratase in catechol pathway